MGYSKKSKCGGKGGVVENMIENKSQEFLGVLLYC